MLRFPSLRFPYATLLTLHSPYEMTAVVNFCSLRCGPKSWKNHLQWMTLFITSTAKSVLTLRCKTRFLCPFFVSEHQQRKTGCDEHVCDGHAASLYNNTLRLSVRVWVCSTFSQKVLNRWLRYLARTIVMGRRSELSILVCGSWIINEIMNN